MTVHLHIFDFAGIHLTYTQAIIETSLLFAANICLMAAAGLGFAREVR